LKLAVFTNDTRFLDPVPAATEFYRRSQLRDGTWARFYELKTGRPLYIKSIQRTAYWLTYTDEDLPDHYAMQRAYFGDGLEEFAFRDSYRAVEKAARKMIESGLEAYSLEQERMSSKPLAAEDLAKLEASVRAIIDSQDDQGRWVQDWRGQSIIQLSTFQQNMDLLSEYIRLAK
jgi:hypothetical protein